jgi:hypothetical protein
MKLVILATKFNDTPEADRIFERRGWKKVIDETEISPRSQVLRKKKLETRRITVDVVEIHYEE